MEVLVDSQIDKKEWSSFYEANSFKSPFQTETFLHLINSINGFEAKVYAINDNGKLASLCVVTFQKEQGIKGFFSRRAIIYGGPLLTANKDAAKVLLQHIARDFKKAIYIETRNFNDYSGHKSEFESVGWKFVPYLNYHLDCSSEELVWKQFNTNRQRQIKRALKSGVTIEEAKTDDDVKVFYNILAELYSTKIKKPLFPMEFFQKMVTAEVGKILLVKFEDRIIGGIACPIVKSNTIYELYICGLDQEYKDCSPSVMATYAAIDYAIKNNIKRFDFMGAGQPGSDYGVRDFKGKFGGTLVEHGRFIKINNSFLYGVGKLGLKILSCLKGSKQE